jgi:Trypsin-like peptidase domain
MTAEEVRAGEIVLAAVAPFVIGVFTKRGPQQQDWTFATGTAIEFNGRKVILTAAHVVSENAGEQPSDLVFLPMAPGGFTIGNSLDEGNYRRSQRWDTSQIVGERQTDLAAILFTTPPPIAFFPIRDELTPPLAPRQPVAICGYPKAKSKTVRIETVVTDLALADFQGASVIDRSSVPAIQPFQFAIDYPKMTGVVQPGGYSGSMVWYDKANSGTLAQLQQQLMLAAGGVVTDHDPAHNALLCTDANAIVRFLSQIS